MRNLSIVFMLAFAGMNGQVGIATNNPDPSSDLTLGSNDKGLLLNQVIIENLNDKTFKNNLNEIKAGTVVYNLGNVDIPKGFYIHSGNQWEKMIGEIDFKSSLNNVYALNEDANWWKLGGNKEIDESTNFIGTIDEKPLIVKTNSQSRINVSSDGKIGINNDYPQVTLDVAAVAKDGTTAEGFIPPRLTGDELKLSDDKYRADLHSGAMVYVTSAVTNPSEKTKNISSPGYYYFDGNIWNQVTITDSESLKNNIWVKDSSKSRIVLDKKSDGKSRSAGTNLVIKDDGGIGFGTENPNSSAILDINSSNKGVVLPRIGLTGIYDVTTIPNPAIGLIIYNTGTNGLKYIGYISWNGTEWRSLDNAIVNSPSIERLLCANAELSPRAYEVDVPYIGTLKVPYTGGNGGIYTSGSTFTSNGLKFTLRNGRLEFGSGELIFSVEGIPTISSPETTNILLQGLNGNNLIPFLTSGLECEISIGSSTEARIDDEAFSGSLTFTNVQEREGYHFISTTPDGKWSIRCFVTSGSAFQAANLQMRYNGNESDPETVAIIQNNSALYFGGIVNNQQNQSIYPKNKWAGIEGNSLVAANAVVQNNLNFPANGDPGVYHGGYSEYRYNNWTDFSPKDKVFYQLEFMMASTVPGAFANADNCPKGVCHNTQVFFKIRQITAK